MDKFESLLDGLQTQGWAQSDVLLSSEQRLEWQIQAESELKSGLFRPAEIAQGKETKIRSDSICWLQADRVEHQKILGTLEVWRSTLTRGLMVSAPQIESHFAHYGPGMHYDLHCDQPFKSGSRVLTFVVYLHSQWLPGHGGELCIFEGPEGRQEIHRIEPRPGRVVVFNSGEIWHQVRESQFHRLSLTGWFRSA